MMFEELPKKEMLILEICALGNLIARDTPTQEHIDELCKLSKLRLALCIYDVGLKHKDCCLPRYQWN